MQILYNIFNTILDAGAVVMLPIIITIIGLIFRVKLSKAFRSGLTIGIGFAGINLVINMMKSNLGPAAQAMVQNFGIKLGSHRGSYMVIADYRYPYILYSGHQHCYAGTEGHRYPGCGYLELSSHGNCRNHGLFCD